MNKENLPKLPKNWKWKRIGEISQVRSGYGFPKKLQGKSDGDIPFFKVSDISKTVFNNEIYMKKTDNYISFNECKEIKADLLKKNTIVFAKIGMAIHLNRRAILAQDSLVDNNVMGIFSDVVDHKYIYYYMLTRKLGKLSRATTVPSIRKSDVERISFPLAPLKIQVEITSKIEELFTQLEAGIKSLKKTKAQLHTYHQAILKAAFEGRLTEKWRETELQKPNSECSIESKLNLFERIQRKTKYNDNMKQISKMYKSDTELNIALPKGWLWGTFLQIGEWVGGGTPSKRNLSYWENGTIPWITPKDMKKLKILDSIDKITEKGLDNSAAKLIPVGSILFVVRSGILRRTLPTALAKVDLTINQDLKAFLPLPIINEDFLLYLTIALNDDIRTSCKKDGTTVDSIEFPALKKYKIPIPTLPEQEIIVEKIEQHYSSIDYILENILANLKKTNHLYQSILNKAFQGKLVLQTSNCLFKDKTTNMQKIKSRQMRLTDFGDKE